MAKLRKGKCYSEVRRAYTRIAQRVPKRSYIKGVPGSKIRQFEMGNKKQDFDAEIFLIAKRPAQIRHNAIEAARETGTRLLKLKGGTTWFFQILVHPHQVMRENPIAMGAGADRFSTGMRKAFGKPVGFCAVVKEGRKIMCIKTTSKLVSLAKECLRKAGSKLPIPVRIEVNMLKKEAPIAAS